MVARAGRPSPRRGAVLVKMLTPGISSDYAHDELLDFVVANNLDPMLGEFFFSCYNYYLCSQWWRFCAVPFILVYFLINGAQQF